MKKKILILTGILFISIVTLTGCGKKDENINNDSNLLQSNSEVNQETSSKATNESDFEFDEVKQEITKYKGKDTNVVVPDKINEIDVKSIGDEAFYNKNLNIDSIIFPDTIESIGHSAFAGNNITEVEFPKNIKKISSYAFKENKITSLEFPEGLEYIGMDSFAMNPLEEVKISSTVKYYGTTAFKYYKDKTTLKKLYIVGRENLDGIDAQYDWNYVGDEKNSKGNTTKVKITPVFVQQ